MGLQGRAVQAQRGHRCWGEDVDGVSEGVEGVMSVLPICNADINELGCIVNNEPNSLMVRKNEIKTIIIICNTTLLLGRHNSPLY